jgi:hypothetical protein
MRVGDAAIVWGRVWLPDVGVSAWIARKRQTLFTVTGGDSEVISLEHALGVTHVFVELTDIEKGLTQIRSACAICHKEIDAKPLHFTADDQPAHMLCLEERQRFEAMAQMLERGLLF